MNHKKVHFIYDNFGKERSVLRTLPLLHQQRGIAFTILQLTFLAALQHLKVYSKVKCFHISRNEVKLSSTKVR